MKWLCRAALGIILIHVLSPTYFLKRFIGLDDSGWLIAYLLVLGLLFFAYLVKVETLVLRAFRYVGPFDSISLIVLVFLSTIGSNLASYSLALVAPIEGSMFAFAETVALGFFGAVVGFSFQALFRRLRGFLVSLPHDLLQPNTAILLVVFLLPLSVLYGRVEEPFGRFLAGTFSVAAAIGIVIGMTLDAREIWRARLRTRAYLVVFPKRNDSIDQKHAIEAALAQGRLNEASSQIAVATGLSVRDRQVLLMTHAYLSGDFDRLRLWAKREQLDTGSQRVLTLLANAAFEEGKHEEAIKLLEEAQHAKNNAYLQVNLALFYSFLGRLKDALRSATTAHAIDAICPVITAVYVCLSYEASDRAGRRRNVDKWLGLIRQAASSYESDYGAEQRPDGSKKMPQTWRSVLYLVMTEATLLIEKGDRHSLATASKLLSEAEGMAPFDPWVRAKIAEYYLGLSRFADSSLASQFALATYRFKAHWQERSARHLVELDEHLSERAV